MYNTQDIANRIKQKTKENNSTVKALLDVCDLNKNCIASIANGSDIGYQSFIKIADYLGCSVDYLLGRDIKNSVPDDDIRNAIYEIINNLPDEKRIRLLGYLEALAAE